MIPHSEESERAVLAAVLLNPELAAELGDVLAPEAFFFERHQEIAKAFAVLAKADRQIDLRSLQAHLETAGAFELVGGLAYLAGLDMDMPDLDHFQTYAGIVRELWAKRRLIEVAQEITVGAMNGQGAAETIAAAEQALADVERGQLEAGNVEKVGDLALELTLQRADSGLVGITTGLADVDKVTSGLRPSRLITLSGATGMGKTAAALCFGTAAARSGAKVLVISIEMTEEEVMKRCVSISTQVPHGMIDEGRVPSQRLPQVMDGMREWCDLPMWVCDDPQTPQSIAATARRQRVQHGLDFLIVDYLGLVQYAGKKLKTHEQLGDMAWSLKMLSKSLEIPVLMLHQLSRGVEKRNPPKPILADLRDSGHLENHSDMVIFVYRPGYYEEDDESTEAEIIIAKNRGGRTGSVPAVWLGNTMTFRDQERHQDERQAPSGW